LGVERRTRSLFKIWAIHRKEKAEGIGKGENEGLNPKGKRRNAKGEFHTEKKKVATLGGYRKRHKGEIDRFALFVSAGVLQGRKSESLQAKQTFGVGA